MKPRTISMRGMQHKERQRIAESALEGIAELHEAGVTLGRFSSERIYLDSEGVFFPDIRKLSFLAAGESPVPEMLFVLAELVNGGVIEEAEIGRYAGAYLARKSLCGHVHEYFSDPHNYRRMTTEEHIELYCEGYRQRRDAKAKSHDELKCLVEGAVKRYRKAAYFVNRKGDGRQAAQWGC